VSYYAKGSLIAACIDLRLRQTSAGSLSLDHVMQKLWADYCAHGRGIGEQQIQQLIAEMAGSEWLDLLHEWIYGRSDLPLPQLLAAHGVEVEQRVAASAADKGGKPVEGTLPQVDLGAVLKDTEAGLAIQRVTEAGAAQQAGLASGDCIIAINSLRLSLAQLEARLRHACPGERLKVHAFRRDELHEFEVELQPAERNTFVLRPPEISSEPSSDASPLLLQQGLRDSWLSA